MPLRFLLALVLWTVAGNAVLANTHVESAVVVPFSEWQGRLAARYVVGGPLQVSVAPGCSGLDVMSLCVAALLSYPIRWRRRAIGAAIGVALLLILNVARIAALAVAAGTPAFNTLHVYVWPALLVAATLAWIAIWIRLADRSTSITASTGGRFLLWSMALLAVYAVAVQQLTDAHLLDGAAREVAGMAARVLSALGTSASVTGNVLQARHVAYLITPECITTPLVALYLAALFATPLSWQTRVIGVVVCLPLFAALSVLRLLTVALPPLILGSDLILTHAFHQIVAGVVAVIGCAIWARREWTRAQAVGTALLAAAVAAAVASVIGIGYARALAAVLHTVHLPVPLGLTPAIGAGEVQGATVVMPIFQVVLFLALAGVAWTRTTQVRWGLGALALIVSQIAVLAGMGWAEAAGLPPLPPLLIRGWAVALPMLLVLAVCRDAASADRAVAQEVPA